MDEFEKKTLKVARGYHYTYYTSPAIESSSPALLFLHGWPDSASLWQYVATHLLSLSRRHRLIIPDLLGVGGTSKPTHSPAYTFSYMTKDLCQILDGEKVTTAIPVGHDWGSIVAQRFCLYAPERTAGLVMLNVCYLPANYERLRTIDEMNEGSKRAFGYASGEYWKLFTAPDGPALMNAHPEKVWDACHGDEEDWMKRIFCMNGALRRYLEDDNWKTTKLKSYAQDENLKREFVERIKRDGTQGGLMYYRAGVDGCQFEAELEIPKERLKLEMPVLFFGCSKDAVCRKEVIGLAQGMGLLPDLKVVELDCGHWSPFEKPDEVADAIAEFVRKRF